MSYQTVLSESDSFTEDISLRKGNIYIRNSEAWIAIDFYEPNKLFLEDSFRTLVIFIHYDNLGIEERRLVGDTSIYFVYGGVRTDRGQMKASDLVLLESKEGQYSISGDFESKHIYDDGSVVIDTLSARLKEIPLRRVEKKESLVGNEIINYMKEQYNIAW